MTRARCPICGELALRRDQNPAFPFCSPRCKLVDLGQWLGEGYRVPDERPVDGPRMDDEAFLEDERFH